MKLPRFGVEEWLNVHEQSARYNLASVSIRSMALDELFALTQTDGSAFFQKLQKTTLNYGWIEGSPAFKEAVAGLYEHQSPDNILQTNGATGGNLLALYSLVEPGDHVISLYPSYQQLYDIPKSFGAEVDFWHIRKDLNWLPDLDELRRLIRPNTKLICINNANNPTGAVMDRAFLLELVDIAQSVGASRMRSIRVLMTAWKFLLYAISMIRVFQSTLSPKPILCPGFELAGWLPAQVSVRSSVITGTTP